MYSMTATSTSRRVCQFLRHVAHLSPPGLLPDPPRTDAGFWIYSAAHASRLRFILRAREIGCSTDDVRGLLGLEDGVEPTGADVLKRTTVNLPLSKPG